jgi:hypothetical protein
MMAQANPSTTRKPTPSKAAKPADRRNKTPLDRIYSRIKLSQRFLVRTQEEVALFQAREPVDSQARPVLSELARLIDLEKRLNDATAAAEKLAKLEWSPKGAVVKSTFTPGQKVEIATDKQGHFLRHGLYDAATIAAPAKVEKVAGGQAVIKLKDGSIISPISAAWLRLIEEQD